MRLLGASLRHRATVFFLMAVTLALGLDAYLALPRERYPDIEVPLVLVYVAYPGAAPFEVEAQLTTPIERELMGMAGLEELTSVSREGLSAVTVELAAGTEIDSALARVRDRVDRVRVDFPEEAEEPFLQEINFSDFPVLQVHLFGDVGPVALKRLAEDLQDEIEAVPGVLRAGLVGGREREVRVEVDPERLRLHGCSLDEVVEAIRDSNVSIPGGELDLGEQTYAVRVPGEVEDPLEVASFVIDAREGRPIFVHDVAEVTFGFQDRTSYARVDGQESVALSVQKRLGANIISVTDRVKAVLEREQSRWPIGVRATVLGDQSLEIRRQVKDLENSILSGLLLVVGVLMLALGFRTALFVGLAIPFSMLLTFLALELEGTTLNMVVLFALVLAVGMLVDNAVVVIENIYRHMQEGMVGRAAAERATTEVGAAIVVSTMTTLGAFAPLLFWPGVIGDFMAYLPRTLGIALLASLLVAFTVNPVLCSVFLRVTPPEAAAGGVGLTARLGRRISETYGGLLRAALDHRLLTLGGSLGFSLLFLLAFARFHAGIELMPVTEPNRIYVDVETAPGTRLEKADRHVRLLEERLASLGDLEVLAAGTGEGSQADGFGGGNDRNAARLTLELVPRRERRRSSFETLAEARRLSAGLPGATVDVDQPEEGPPTGPPLAVELTGDDFAVLAAAAARIRREIEDIPGLVSLDDDFDRERPEVRVLVDRTEAARLGLTTAEISGTIRTAVNGREASTYRLGDEEIAITVRLGEEARASLEDLRRLVVVNEAGDQIPLEVVTRIERTASVAAIRHKGRRRMVTVSGKVTEPRLAEPVREEARARIEAMADLLPAGYRIELAGQSEDEEEAKAFLFRAFAFAVVIVLALMVGKFDSLAIPLIILTSVLMSMIGVAIGLLATRMPFGIIMTGVGVISLAGIVVNNAIVLLDYGEKLWAAGIARRQVVLRTGLRRLRPVLLTAVTTILGLIPLTTGLELDFRTLAFSTGSESSQYWRSMGVAVIFGLGFATFLTLILVPVLYDLLLGWRERRARAS